MKELENHLNRTFTKDEVLHLLEEAFYKGRNTRYSEDYDRTTTIKNTLIEELVSKNYFKKFKEDINQNVDITVGKIVRVHDGSSLASLDIKEKVYIVDSHKRLNIVRDLQDLDFEVVAINVEGLYHYETPINIKYKQDIVIKELRTGALYATCSKFVS